MDPVETVLQRHGLQDFSNAGKSLGHYGTKGMKWGVRKSSAPSGPSEVSVSTKTTKKGTVQVVTKGGKGQPPSEDAIKAAVAIQKARSSSTASLSNAELQAAVKRMELETKYATAIAGKPPPGNPAVNFVKQVVKDEAKSEVRNLVQGKETKFLHELLGYKKSQSGAGGKHKAPAPNMMDRIKGLGKI